VIDLGRALATIELKIESKMVDLRKPRIRRYTHADQQSRFPTDKIFEFVDRIQTESLEWKG